MQKWKSLGLQPGDTTDTSTAQDYFGSQKLFSVVASINPEQDVSYSSDDFEVASATLTSDAYLSNSQVTEYMWGIAANCERPDKAMDFLNYIYENPEVANILMYGVEGLTYDFEDGSDDIVVPYGNYDTTFTYLGNTSEMYIEYPAGEDYNDQLVAFEDSAILSPLIGYMFDDTDFQTESSMLDSTITQYLPTLQAGACGDEDATRAKVEEFISALQTAGIDDVIAANQEQMDAYLAEQ